MQGSGEPALPLSSMPSLAHGACQAAAAAAELEARSKEFGAETVSSSRSDATTAKCSEICPGAGGCEQSSGHAGRVASGLQTTRNCLNFPKAAVLQAEWCPPTGRGRNPSMQDWKCQNCVSERCASSSRSVQGSWTWKPRRELRRKSIASREPREPRVSTSTLSWSRGGSDAPGGLQRIQLRGP